MGLNFIVDMLYCGGLDWTCNSSKVRLYFNSKCLSTCHSLLPSEPLGRGLAFSSRSCRSVWTHLHNSGWPGGAALKSGPSTWKNHASALRMGLLGSRSQVTCPRSGAEQQPGLPPTSSLPKGGGEDASPNPVSAASKSFLPSFFVAKKALRGNHKNKSQYFFSDCCATLLNNTCKVSINPQNNPWSGNYFH